MATPKFDEAAIFNAARQITAPEARRLFLEQACGGNAQLQRRLEALLRIYDKDHCFWEAPTHDAAVQDAPLQDAPTEGARTISEDRISEGPGTRIGAYKLLEQ